MLSPQGVVDRILNFARREQEGLYSRVDAFAARLRVVYQSSWLTVVDRDITMTRESQLGKCGR